MTNTNATIMDYLAPFFTFLYNFLIYLHVQTFDDYKDPARSAILLLLVKWFKTFFAYLSYSSVKVNPITRPLR